MVDFQIVAVRRQGGFAVFPIHQMPVQPGYNVGEGIFHPFHDLGDAEFLFGEFVVFKVDRDFHDSMVSARLGRRKRGKLMMEKREGQEGL